MIDLPLSLELNRRPVLEDREQVLPDHFLMVRVCGISAIALLGIELRYHGVGVVGAFWPKSEVLAVGEAPYALNVVAQGCQRCREGVNHFIGRTRVESEIDYVPYQGSS